MYSKGGNMLHMLRQIVNDDGKWRAILRGLNSEFYHQVVKGSQIEDYLSEKTGMNLKPFFNQYLRDTRIPVFEYFIRDRELSFRWDNCVRGFAIPVKVNISGKTMILNPSTAFRTVHLDRNEDRLTVDPGWYVSTFNLTGK